MLEYKKVIIEMATTNPTAFDAFAADYDSDFTDTPLGRLLRPRVWQTFAQYFKPGQHILELTCGTGEDAVWLARHGVQVTATDGSAAMVQVAQAKAEAAEVADRVAVQQVSLQNVIDGCLEQPFDGVYSNFGGLNTINDWTGLAESLAGLIQPGGKAILVPMGPLCPWEIGWYLLHGQPKTAFRRFARDGAPAKIGEALIPIWYPSVRRLRTDFAPWFRYCQSKSLGLWLPPSYLDHFVNRWPTLFATLNRLEQTTARLTGNWGDHYVLVLERVSIAK